MAGLRDAVKTNAEAAAKTTPRGPVKVTQAVAAKAVLRTPVKIAEEGPVPFLTTSRYRGKPPLP